METRSSRAHTHTLTHTLLDIDVHKYSSKEKDLAPPLLHHTPARQQQQQRKKCGSFCSTILVEREARICRNPPKRCRGMSLM